MNVLRKYLALLVLALISGAAMASPATLGGPTTGLWGNPQDSGRGFNIDIQGNTMVVTTYVYTQTGVPIWYLSAGTYDPNSGYFQSTYDSYSNGQCFGCPSAGDTLHSGAGGTISITFHNNTSATLTYPGGSIEIRKLNYGFGDSTSVLYGEWALSYNISGLIGGDWVIFDHPYTGTDGTVYAAGHSDLSPQNIALGYYDPATNRWYIIVSVGSFTDDYMLGMDDHRALGSAWVEPSGVSISGTGSPAVAGRLLFKGELVNAATAPTQKSLQVDEQSKYVVHDASPADPAVVSAFGKLHNAMGEIKASHY